MSIYNVIRKPRLTEKTMYLVDQNHYTFVVHPKANKLQIAESIEKAFGVTVLKVRTMNLEGKKKRLGRFVGKRADWKKAIVTLKDGDSIKYFEGA
jgi:large subunit ribosomal protein L23